MQWGGKTNAITFRPFQMYQVAHTCVFTCGAKTSCGADPSRCQALPEQPSR